MLNKTAQFNKGFTLIEVLVAVFILTVGVVGVSTLVGQTTAFSQVTSFNLLASYLAQEGMEIVKNIRDTNLLEEHKTGGGIPWDRGLASGAYYNFDYKSASLPDNSNCSSKNYLKEIGGFFECSSLMNFQKLQRKITITPDGSDILKISVEVSWEERGRPHKVTAQENLYKWIQ